MIPLFELVYGPMCWTFGEIIDSDTMIHMIGENASDRDNWQDQSEI